MAGLPKLPGFTFRDSTLTKFHLSQTFDLLNGYKLPKNQYSAVGGKESEQGSVKYFPKSDITRFDPSLTYGRSRTEALPQFVPHYALYDQKCLTFKAFFKQAVVESPNEFFRVRHVNIIYFLEDDTITVIEPRVQNSGIDQGKLIRRCKIPIDDSGHYYHWKHLNVGKDLAFYGNVYHTVDCDLFTREYMASQGIVIADSEEMPVDPYMHNRLLQVRRNITRTPPADDKLRRFLEYDGKILKFKAVWDNREDEYGTLEKYEILYFLSDDTVSVKEVHAKNDGKDPYPVLLRKTKLPKRYTDTPATYPAIYLELSDAEVTEYYQPKDFQIGETIFILGRDMMLYDCDKFTRDYFSVSSIDKIFSQLAHQLYFGSLLSCKKALRIEQKSAIDISEKQPAPPPRQVAPHDGLGSLEDSIQNTLTFQPKPPKKDVMKQLLNANKYLRYELVMDVVHPEDSIRRFILKYSLADGTCNILEPPIKNSGILGGKYLRNTLLVKPGSDPLNPDYYTPSDFYIGATITIFQQRFKIIGADLYVYRYMEANSSKFPCEVIETLRNYMYNKGYLKDDEDDQFKENLESERKWDYIPQGNSLKQTTDECMEKFKVGTGYDPQSDRQKLEELLDHQKDSIKHKPQALSYGIKKIGDSCPYPVEIGQVHNVECPRDGVGQYTSYTPEHVDTPEEKVAKYYADVLQNQKAICNGGKQIECTDPPEGNCDKEVSKPIMVTIPKSAEQDCQVKHVSFSEDNERCTRDTDNLCGLKTEKTHCNCTEYQK